MAVGTTTAVASRAAVRQRYFPTINGNVQFQALRCDALNAISLSDTTLPTGGGSDGSQSIGKAKLWLPNSALLI